MKYNVLVIGGSGYIGSNCCKSLYDNGFFPIVIDKNQCKHSYGDYFNLDISNIEEITQIIQKYNPIAVMHFGAYIEVGESVRDPMKYYDNNFSKNVKLLKIFSDYNMHVIFSSSAAVYGNPANQTPLVESSITNPINPYGQTKLMMEKLLFDYDNAYGLKSVSFRYFNAAGADIESNLGENHQPETHLIPLIFNAIENNKTFKINGFDFPTFDGTCIRDFIHVKDIAEAHVIGLKYLLNGGKTNIFNLGTGMGNSILQVIEIIEKNIGKSIDYAFGSKRLGDPAYLVADPSKANNLLSWLPKYSSIDNIVQDAWKWHQYCTNNKEYLLV